MRMVISGISNKQEGLSSLAMGVGSMFFVD
jgi:hypothetical protein